VIGERDLVNNALGERGERNRPINIIITKEKKHDPAVYQLKL
jgi:hypothetical protein